MSPTLSALGAVVRRDLTLAARRRVDALLPVVFFVVAASLFPLGVGPEPAMLRTIAPGVVWVGALLAALMSLPQLYAGDHADGTLEQMLLAGLPAWSIALARAASHWMVTGLPLVLVSPLLALAFGLPGDATRMLVVSLLLGTPVLSLLGGLGAALTLGLRSGTVLVVLLVLPLCIPSLIFGTGAVGAVQAGLSAAPHLSLLGALLLFTLGFAPAATGAALSLVQE